jgi:peptide/nickel transport system permease protein
VLSPWLWAADAYQPSAAPLLSPAEHPPLGTDTLGREFHARLAYGSLISPSMALAALAITIALGGLAGMTAAFVGGWIERILLGIVNSALAVPGILLALVLVAGRGPGIVTVILAVGIGGAPAFARLSRTIFMQERDLPYVLAAEALGADGFRIAFRHILPNAIGQILPLATTFYAWTFLGLTTLTFLGLTGDPSLPEWGAMLNSGRLYLLEAPWLVVLPGSAISLTILSVHNLGEWLVERKRPT